MENNRQSNNEVSKEGLQLRLFFIKLLDIIWTQSRSFKKIEGRNSWLQKTQNSHINTINIKCILNGNYISLKNVYLIYTNITILTQSLTPINNLIQLFHLIHFI